MLKYEDWLFVKEALEEESNNIKNKIEYRKLELVGPAPSDPCRGQHYMDKENIEKIDSDMELRQLLHKQSIIEHHLLFVLRTGCLPEDLKDEFPSLC